MAAELLVLAGPEEAPEHRAPRHPERPERVAALMAGVSHLDLGDDLRVLEAGAAPREALSRVHELDYLGQLEVASDHGLTSLDPDTYLTPASWPAALRAAGGGLAVTEALAAGRGSVGLVATRPPGHHATRRAGMGFCLVNNVAVSAAALAEAGERVVILDWDVHHGNGTQDIFWDDPRVLYASLHQSPLYPGTGRADEVGGPRARGTTVNVPLPPGATGDVAMAAVEEVVAPAVDAFGPTWVLVSAGFDAHRRDPLAELRLTAGDFAALAGAVADFAPQPGRVVLFFEGGYDLEAVESSVAAALARLLGTEAASEPPSAGGPGREAVRQVAQRRRAVLEDTGGVTGQA